MSRFEAIAQYDLVLTTLSDTEWWAANVGSFPDEWTWCSTVGFSVCGPLLEKRYASFFTTADISTLR